MLSNLLRPSVFVFFLLCSHAFAQSLPQVKNLKTEYLIDPIGLDNPKPRLTWQMDDARMGAQQTAYRISLNIDSVALTQGKNNFWDTGWLQTSTSLKTYAGPTLKPFTKYFWKVELKDQKGNLLKGKKIASFEMGMMNGKNWRGLMDCR